MLFSISGIDVIYCGQFRFDSIRANWPRCDSDPKIVRSLVKTVTGMPVTGNWFSERITGYTTQATATVEFYRYLAALV